MGNIEYYTEARNRKGELVGLNWNWFWRFYWFWTDTKTIRVWARSRPQALDKMRRKVRRW